MLKKMRPQLYNNPKKLFIGKGKYGKNTFFLKEIKNNYKFC